MTYPKKKFKFGKDVALVMAPDYVFQAVELILTDEVYQMDTPLATNVRELASELKKQRSSSYLKDFSQNIVLKLWHVVMVLRGKTWTEKLKTVMWTEFHCCRSDPGILKEWHSLLDVCQIKREAETELFVLQHLFEEVHKTLLNAVMDLDMPAPTLQSQGEELSKEEEQALRYAVGYVPYKLLKKYKKMKKNVTAQNYIKILSSWAEQSGVSFEETHGFFSYSTQWIELQNRGLR